MAKYEYKVFIHSGEPKPTELLNEYGKEGWRLVSTSPVNNTVCYVMEREIPKLDSFADYDKPIQVDLG